MLGIRDPRSGDRSLEGDLLASEFVVASNYYPRTMFVRFTVVIGLFSVYRFSAMLAATRFMEKTRGSFGLARSYMGCAIFRGTLKIGD